MAYQRTIHTARPLLTKIGAMNVALIQIAWSFGDPFEPMEDVARLCDEEYDRFMVSAEESIERDERINQARRDAGYPFAEVIARNDRERSARRTSLVAIRRLRNSLQLTPVPLDADMLYRFDMSLGA